MSNWYVRPTGTSYGLGNGTSFNNAWSGFSAVDYTVMVGGDTLFVNGTFDNEKFLIKTVSGATIGNELIITGENASTIDMSVTSDNTVEQFWGQHYIILKDISIANSLAGSVSACLSMNYGNFQSENIYTTGGKFGVIISPGTFGSISNTNITKSDVSGCSQNGILVSASNASDIDLLTISSTEIYNNASDGIQLVSGGGGTDGRCKNITIDKCKSYKNAGGGITVTTQSLLTTEPILRRPYGIIIKNTDAFSNQGVGIALSMTTNEGWSKVQGGKIYDNSLGSTPGGFENYGCDNLIVEYVEVFDNHTNAGYDGSGLWIDMDYTDLLAKQANNCICRYNYIHDNNDHDPYDFFDAGYSGTLNPPSSGIRLLGATNCKVYGNLLINNGTGIVLSYQPTKGVWATGNEIHSNIVIKSQAGVYFRDISDNLNTVYKNMIIDCKHGLYGDASSITGGVSENENIVSNYSLSRSTGVINNGVISSLSPMPSNAVIISSNLPGLFNSDL